MKKSCLLVFIFFGTFLFAQEKPASYVAEHYTKKEVRIKMRDGASLFTSIYSPKDTSKKYPIIMQRTPYDCAPYGEDKFKRSISPSETMMKEGYIVVYHHLQIFVDYQTF